MKGPAQAGSGSGPRRKLSRSVWLVLCLTAVFVLACLVLSSDPVEDRIGKGPATMLLIAAFWVFYFFLDWTYELELLRQAREDFSGFCLNAMDREIARVLKRGVPSSQRDKDRTLAAMATFGRVDTLKLLLRADANPNARDANGVRPLMCAARYGQVAAVKALLKAGAGVNRADNEGSTALLVAVRYNEQAVVRALLNAGADVNVQDATGGTPLMMAAAQGTPKCIQLLVKAGADLNTRGPDGLRPLDFAALAGSPENIRALIEAGAEVNAHDDSGYTALMAATGGKPGQPPSLKRTAGKVVPGHAGQQASPGGPGRPEKP